MCLFFCGSFVNISILSHLGVVACNSTLHMLKKILHLYYQINWESYSKERNFRDGHQIKLS